MSRVVTIDMKALSPTEGEGKLHGKENDFRAALREPQTPKKSVLPQEPLQSPYTGFDLLGPLIAASTENAPATPVGVLRGIPDGARHDRHCWSPFSSLDGDAQEQH